VTIIQGTEEWHAMRIGKVTASRLADVLAKIKTGEAAVRANYKAEIVAERLTGKRADGFTNAAIKWGTDAEPLARAAYEAEADPLFFKSQRGEATQAEWLAKVAEIKARFPA
jgi:hypothetical protein